MMFKDIIDIDEGVRLGIINATVEAGEKGLLDIYKVLEIAVDEETIHECLQMFESMGIPWATQTKATEYNPLESMGGEKVYIIYNPEYKCITYRYTPIHQYANI